ncbi:MAG: DUF5818 domain-containing protein [Acidobacteriota bacterium]
MKMLKREICLFFAAIAFVVLYALAWGKPFLSKGAHPRAGHARMQTAPAATVLAGTVLRQGDELIFRTAAGQIYRFDQPQLAASFAGQPVTITGSLDARTGTVHIDGIRPAA